MIFFTIIVIQLLIYKDKYLPSSKSKKSKGNICIIIDDFGYTENNLARDFLNLSNDFTISVIPGKIYSEDIAHMAYKYGFEVMIHMPMEPYNWEKDNKHRYCITDDLTAQEVESVVNKAFIEIPIAQGMNNHQGSKATENLELMKYLARSLKKIDKFFIDSYTSQESKAFITMRQFGVPTDIRQVFLDNINHPDSIKSKLDELVELSSIMNYAIGIGHVKHETYKILLNEIPKLKKEGYSFLLASEVVR